jgi:hypothetical protein
MPVKELSFTVSAVSLPAQNIEAEFHTTATCSSNNYCSLSWPAIRQLASGWSENETKQKILAVVRWCEKLADTEWRINTLRDISL